MAGLEAGARNDVPLDAGYRLVCRTERQGDAHASGRRLLLVGLAVVAARIWRSVPAAITLFAIT
ncbi:MAG TPA: hypothetical protein VH279_02535 [Solirubrobacteraceae bacterium]|jgi:hypothetical protein|nr:hypothetical protein [Solirubrobacteraceae bacterium]